MPRNSKKAAEPFRAIFGTLCLVMLVVLPALAGTECETEHSADFESELVALINVQRASNGLMPLLAQPGLSAAAREHGVDMACNSLSSHIGSNGSSTKERVIAQGYPFLTIGENIAAGYDTPREVVTEWMNSPKHRRILLDPSFTEVGAGYIYHSNSTYGSYWTVLFGKPSKESRPVSNP